MSATQIPPTLSIIEDDGEFIVRVGAQANAAGIAQALVPVIAKLGGARKLTLVTPTDIKSFKFNGAHGEVPLASPAGPGPNGRAAQRSIVRDLNAPPTEEDATADFERFVAEEKEAERLAREMESTNQADAHLPEPEEAAKPQKRQKSTEPLIEPAGAACGRCQGAGTLPGGGTCPVCRGKGVISKWGRKKR